MQIVEVDSRKTKKLFHDTARIIYRNDNTWVCPLDKEIKAIFDPEKNPYYRHGEAIRWLLLDGRGKPAGRIAAFIDYKTSGLQDQPTGGMGFFECINDKKAAFLLFDVAREWLKEKGMEAMDGPINFGESDKYWGLLVDGFTHPSYEIVYNHPYYQELFEEYGFKVYYKMEGFHLDVTKDLPSRFLKIAEWIEKKPDYSFRHMDWKKNEQQIKDFVEVFNKTWASFKEGFEPLKPEYIEKTLKKARAIIDEEFIWIAYFKEQPVAIYLMYPDANMIFKHLKGKLTLPAMIKFLWLKRRKTMTRARGLLMGVIPEFQGKGIESGIILNVARAIRKKPHYTEIEFSWVGDFNPKMRKLFILVGSGSAKHYITYRYLFDREAEFKRYPVPEE